MDNCTCVIASHISSEDRLYWLCEAVDSASHYFPTLLALSCHEQLKKVVEREIETFPCLVYFTDEQRTQFEHISAIAEEITTDYVIFLDDDDFFLPSLEAMFPLLLERYGQYEGVQEIHYNGCAEVEEILCDFSGTFCSTVFLLDFLREYRHELNAYDCDCVFREVLTEKGKGRPKNKERYYHNYDIDADIIPFVYRREHDLPRDWCFADK